MSSVKRSLEEGSGTVVAPAPPSHQITQALDSHSQQTQQQHQQAEVHPPPDSSSVPRYDQDSDYPEDTRPSKVPRLDPSAGSVQNQQTRPHDDKSSNPTVSSSFSPSRKEQTGAVVSAGLGSSGEPTGSVEPQPSAYVAPPIATAPPLVPQLAPPIRGTVNSTPPTAPPLILPPKAPTITTVAAPPSVPFGGRPSLAGDADTGAGMAGQSSTQGVAKTLTIHGATLAGGSSMKVKEEGGPNKSQAGVTYGDKKSDGFKQELMKENSREGPRTMGADKVGKMDKEREKVKDERRGEDADKLKEKAKEREEADDGVDYILGNIERANRSNRVLRPRQLQGIKEPRSRHPGGSDTMPFVEYRPGKSEVITEKCKALLAETKEGDQPPVLEIRISNEYLTSSNEEVVARQLWGTDVYTDDSDIVAVLMHTGHYTPTASSPAPLIFNEIRVFVQLLPAQDHYISSLRNSMRSRSWGATSNGCSYTIDKCQIVKSDWSCVDLEPNPMRTPLISPTLAPASQERTVTTRAASQSAYRQQRFTQEVTVLYNLCNEPWMKYQMHIVADRGLKPSQYTSARLKKGDALYVETKWHRYELVYEDQGRTHQQAAGNMPGAGAAPPGSPMAEDGEKGGGDGEKEKDGGAGGGGGKEEKERERERGGAGGGGGGGDGSGAGHAAADEPHFSWSRCTPPLPLEVMRAIGVPLPTDKIKVVEEGLLWEDLQWTPSSVWIRGKEYLLLRAQWMPKKVVD